MYICMYIYIYIYNDIVCTFKILRSNDRVNDSDKKDLG